MAWNKWCTDITSNLTTRAVQISRRSLGRHINSHVDFESFSIYGVLEWYCKGTMSPSILCVPTCS